MPTDGRKMVEGFGKVEALAIGKGGPATSGAMREALESFWLSGVFRFVLRKGRQIGWSTVVVPRIVVTTAMFGEFVQGRGSRGVIGLSSTKQSEADERLYNIERAFHDLGIRAKAKSDGIEVPGRPLVVRSFPAVSDAARGMNAWAWFEDEMPAWRDGDGANPAKERDAAIVPALLGHDEARIYSAGTPMGLNDYHAKLVALGNTASQRVYVGPSWHWRPDLSEARCRELQPDPDMFSREFGAIPFEGDAQSLFSNAALERVTRKGPVALEPMPGVTYFAAQDPASRSNGWTLAIGCVHKVGDASIVQVVRCREWRAPRGGELDPASVFAEIAAELRDYGSPSLWSDQWSFDALSAVAARYGVELQEHAWTAPNKVTAFEALRRRVAEQTVELPDDPQVRADLLGVRKMVSLRGGAFAIEFDRVGARHADYAPAIACLVEKIADDASGGGWFSLSRDEQNTALATMAAIGGQFDPNVLYERAPRPKPPFKVYRESYLTRVVGDCPALKHQTATFMRGHDTEYSANSSQEFREQIEKYRRDHDLL